MSSSLLAGGSDPSLAARLAGVGACLPTDSQPAKRGRQGAAEQGCGGALNGACLLILAERTFTEPSTRCCGQRRASRRSGSSRQSSILGVGDRRRCCRPWACKNGATRRSSLGSLEIRKNGAHTPGLRFSVGLLPPPLAVRARAPASQSVARDRDAPLNEWAAARCPLLFDKFTWIHWVSSSVCAAVGECGAASLLGMTRSRAVPPRDQKCVTVRLAPDSDAG